MKQSVRAGLLNAKKEAILDFLIRSVAQSG